jgi:hypothetical protein
MQGENALITIEEVTLTVFPELSLLYLFNYVILVKPESLLGSLHANVNMHKYR